MSREKFHRPKRDKFRLQQQSSHDEDKPKANAAVVKFYQESRLTHERMDEFNKDVNLGVKDKSREKKEQDIFQKGAEALKSLFSGMKAKGNKMARVNNAAMREEDEYITGEEGLNLDATDRRRRLLALRQTATRYNALGQALSMKEKAELLAAEAEIEKLEKQENENDEEELVDETKTSSENVEDTAEEVQSGSVPNRKPPAFHIANVFRRVAGDIQAAGQKRREQLPKDLLAALKLKEEKEKLKKALTAKVKAIERKQSAKSKRDVVVDVFAKVRDDIERKGAEKQVAEDAQMREDEEEAKLLEEDMKEMEIKIREAVDKSDFELAEELQREMDELKFERDLLRLKPSERGLKRATSRSRSNSGNKVQEFFAEVGRKTAKLATDAKTKLEEAGKSLVKPTNDDIGLVSLPEISQRATTPRSTSKWETQSPMLRIAWEAVEQGDLAKLRQLYQRGVPINDARNKRTTPLHIAAARGYEDVCRLLLLTKADIEAQDAMGQTPMHLAVHYERDDAISFLKSKGASMFTMNIFGRCPYDYNEKLCEKHSS